MASVRYMVRDVAACRDFYVGLLGFEVVENPSGNPVELFQPRGG